MLVPFSAVHRDADGEYVFLLRQDGKAAHTPVHSGSRVADRIELTEGVSPGQTIIVRGFLGLKDEKPVRSVNPGPVRNDDS